jgi:predicted PurR-regulated permease PerM
MSNHIQFNKRTIAYLALNAFGLFIVYLLSDFITSFLGALIFFVLFRRMMNYMVDKHGWRPSTSAILIILLSFIIVLVPVITLSNLLYSKIIQIVSRPETIIDPLKVLDSKMLALTGRQLFSPELILTLQQKIGQIIPSFISKLFVLLGNIGMMYFMLYYMLVQRKNMQAEVNNYLPFNHANIKLLSGELESQTLSNSIGVPLIATIQGTAAGIGSWIFGMDEPIFWAVITAFASIIPIAGSTLVWAPAAIILMATNSLWMGLGLIAYGAIVVINIDNIARFTIQKKFADVHPLITVFGVILGLNLFGIPGLIFGPLMLSYFIIFIKMYRSVYVNNESNTLHENNY